MSPARDRTAGDRWLTSAEHAAWIELRRLLLALPSVLDARTLQQSELTFFEYQILATLSDAVDGTARMSELAQATSASLSRLSHAVSRLEARGFVTRRRCAGVGRSSVASLTPAGRDKLVGAAPAHVASVRALVLDGLTLDQLTALEAIARRIADRLEAGSGETGCGS